MARIAVGGFQHETNTFAPMGAHFADFERHDAWPGLVEGAALAPAVAGLNLPIAGFIEAANGHELVPLAWCAAEPSSYVARDAFERIVGLICARLAAAGPLDAVYLDLHGAMVAEHLEDGEGEILARVRAVVGREVPMVASLDLHANLTERMIAEADALAIYRTYPHIDFAATGARAHALLARLLAGERLAKAFRKLPFLVPLSAQCTDFEPNASLYARLPGLEHDGVVSVDYAAAFPPADIYECGPAVVAYGRDRAAAERAADAMAAAVCAAEPTFENPLIDPDEAVRQAMSNRRPGPVVLADAQDNPGCGGSCDTVGLIEALIRNHARGATLAMIADPEVAAAAHAAGLGATLEVALGGKSGQPGQHPLHGRFRVEALGDGRFTCTGPMLRGTRTELGPMAALAIADADCEVRVIVGTHRFQVMDQAIFRHLGVAPAEARILGVKSTVHFRADFAPIAAAVLTVECPGAHPCRLTKVDYRHLRPGVRLEPLGPAFQPRAAE